MEDNYPMCFEFEGNLYCANKTASELYLHLAYYPPRFPEIPIELPDGRFGRFVRVTRCLESAPPQPADLEIINKYSGKKYAIAELIDD